MIGVILQPTYLPWLGYFEMIAAADVFVVYDHVQFVKKSWHHRNRIKDSNGELTLTLSTKKAPIKTPLYQTELSTEYQKTLTEHWRSISHAYKKAAYFGKYSDSLQEMYLAEYSSLTDLTVSFIRYFCNHLNITTPFVTSSSFLLDKSEVNMTKRVIELCQKSNISSLYDAHGAKDIIDTNLFYINEINISFQNYQHPTYSQLFGKFLPNLSVLDLLLNEGPNSLEIIRKGRCDPIVISHN